MIVSESLSPVGSSLRTVDNKITTPKNQTISLTNRENLLVGETTKIINLKPDLIQLTTIFGDLLILGEKLELTRLDNSTKQAEIKGTINSLKFVQSGNKEPFFRKIFK